MKKKFLFSAKSKSAHTFGAAGDFTASELLDIQLKAEEIWADGKFSDDMRAHADTAIIQLERQSAKFPEMDNPATDRTVKVVWVKSCDETTSDLDRTTDTCSISGTEVETDSETYELNMGQKTTFKVNAEKARTNLYTPQELIAREMMKADKKLSEYLAKKLLLQYKTFAGPNIPVIDGTSTPFTWNAGNTSSDIAAGSYNISIVANLVQQMILNNVDSGYYINRGSLFQEWMNAGLNSGNLDGKGNDARRTQIDLNFDQWNFTKAGITEDMFLVSRNAVAMKTYTRYSDTPQYVGGKINQTRYRIKSNILPDTYWDVIYELSCSGGADFHTFQVMTQFGIWLNPTPCPITVNGTDYTPTGVYSFTKTA